MATKTLSISQEAYDQLIGLKRGDESFSDLILRLTENTSKGISSLLEWLENASEEEDKLLNELADSVELVYSERNTQKWRDINV